MITAKDTPPTFKQIEQLALSRNKEVYTTVSVVYECGERRTYVLLCVATPPLAAGHEFGYAHFAFGSIEHVMNLCVSEMECLHWMIMGKARKAMRKNKRNTKPARDVFIFDIYT